MITNNERPMLFSTPLVRAILDGRKTQTRRPVKIHGESPPHWATFASEGHSPDCHGRTRPTGLFYWSEEQPKAGPLKYLRRWPGTREDHLMAGDYYWAPCPYGRPGDLLYVRETWGPCAGGIVYRADEPSRVVCPDGGKWRPSLHMPKWAARIWLRVTDVRVERVQGISEEDARAEGVTPQQVPPSGWIHRGESHVEAFSSAWAAIYGTDSWNENPWIWRIAFERCEQPGGAR